MFRTLAGIYPYAIAAWAREPRWREGNLMKRPTIADIAARAYEIFESKGRVEGDDRSDWLQAERDLSQ